MFEHHNKKEPIKSDRVNRRNMERSTDTTKCNHHLWRHINNRLKMQLLTEFKYGTNGKWSNMTKNYNFDGNINNFINFISEETDRLDEVKIQYRDSFIDSLI